LNDTLETFGIYDSGSNVSIINSKLIKIKKNINNVNNVNSKNLLTINGVKKTKGIVNIKIKIFNIEKQIEVYIIDEENFENDFLIGLDIIKQFKLIQNEKLQITQQKIDMQGKKDGVEEIPTGKKTNLKLSDKDYTNKDTTKQSINFNEHVDKNNFEIKIDHLDQPEKTEIHKLLEKHKSIFAKDKFDIGTVNEYEARIDLLVDKYCCKRPYRCTIEDKKEIEDQVSKLLEKKLIEESYSPFAAPVTLAFKKEENKRSRLCIDFRDLNKIVVPQAQPFPLIEDLMVKTRNCNYFSTLDINSAFWSIPLRIEDRKKTGFVTQEGHFQWTCLPFGLKTSPAIFQRILSNILRKY